MVLPVTDEDVSSWSREVAVKRGRWLLTSLNEDLHVG